MSHRGDLTERLITILILLAERPHSQQELVKRFGVDSVTIRRNLTELTRHFMIVDEKVGRERVYRFSDNYEFRLPVDFPLSRMVHLIGPTIQCGQIGR